MADIKVTGLSAITPPLDNGSLFLTSSYDGVSAYTSEKLTLTQLRDEVYLMEAEDKISFDSSGTNKTFFEDSTDTGNKIISDSVGGYVGVYSGAGNYFDIQTGGGTSYAESWVYMDSGGSQFGFGQSGGSNGTSIACGSGDDIAFYIQNSTKFLINTTGIGFFGAAAVAKQTSVPVTAAGIHAALVNYGLIT